MPAAPPAECSAPPAEPVVWTCMLVGPASSSRGVQVRARTWFAARHCAAALLQCEPDALVCIIGGPRRGPVHEAADAR